MDDPHSLSTQERALVLRICREQLLLVNHRIEMQKSQRRRGLSNAAALSALEKERDQLAAAVRALWLGST